MTIPTIDTSFEELTFEDTDDRDSESSNAVTIDEIPREQRNLRTQAYDKSISDVVAMIRDGDIVLNPDYQRSYVWDDKKASLLIESILLNVPIPVVYVAEEEDSTWNVVDGLQRLNTLRRFFDNEFKLRGLEVLQELNGVQYSTLNPKAARILRNGILRMILIFKESHPEIKYEIFMRLNRGAIRLNEQELRNCLYRGTLNELLKQLRGNPRFLEMIRLKGPDKRMDDAELVLRYFMISDGWDPASGQVRNYTGKVKSSLNNYFQVNQNPGPERLAELRQRFETTVAKVYAVFGWQAFQRIHEDGTFDPRPNRAIMDFVMATFERARAEPLVAHKTAIHDLLRTMPLRDPKFNEAISLATSDKRALEYRLNAWNAGLQPILQG